MKAVWPEDDLSKEEEIDVFIDCSIFYLLMASSKES